MDARVGYGEITILHDRQFEDNTYRQLVIITVIALHFPGLLND
jgi:hypothetical protein